MSKSSIPEPSETVFLLGAGASVKAGVPATFDFVQEFVDSLGDSGEKQTVQEIVKILEAWRAKRGNAVRQVDVELLLEVLEKLEMKDREPLLEFFGLAEFKLHGYSDKQPILKKLRDFIKKKAIVRETERIGYLTPFLGFIEERRPLDIISVNYDTCIERFSNAHRLSHEDGFDVGWNPDVFEREKTDIRLYKLHGSVIWYRSDRAGYLKLPVMTEESEIQLITGERAMSLMLYPTQKLDYAEPFFELLLRVKSMLENPACRFLVVVGYSFRDEHLRNMLLDVARKNTELTVVLVDPHAFPLFDSRLKYFDQSCQLVSSLDRRVVCLPYPFEKVFPYLNDSYLRSLRNGIRAVADFSSNERRGHRNFEWSDCLASLADAEHTQMIEWLMSTGRLSWSEVEKKDWRLHLEALTKIALNCVANGETNSAERYLASLYLKLKSILGKATVRLTDPRTGGYTVMLSFPGVDNGPLWETLNRLYQCVRSHSMLVDDKSPLDKELQDRFRPINKIQDYLSSLGNPVLPFEKWALLRQHDGKTASVKARLQRSLEARASSDPDGVEELDLDGLQEAMAEIERGAIFGLFA